MRVFIEELPREESHSQEFTLDAVASAVSRDILRSHTLHSRNSYLFKIKLCTRVCLSNYEIAVNRILAHLTTRLRLE